MKSPYFSVGEATTPGLSFAESLIAYREAGVDAIGIVDGQHGQQRGGEDDLARFGDSGLKAGFCIPAVVSVLPRPHVHGVPGSDDPSVRVDQICASLRRLAPFDPVFCVCVPGPVSDYDPARARAIAVQGIKRIAREAADLGITIGIEPLHAVWVGETHTFLTTIPDAVALLDEIDEPNTGLLFDVWHHWDDPDVIANIYAHADRFIGVHVNDFRRNTRSWCDRVLPGDGVMDLSGLLSALIGAGYDGWYELEVVSDDGRNGNAFEDSLWAEDPVALIRRGREQFMKLWEASSVVAAPRPI